MGGKAEMRSPEASGAPFIPSARSRGLQARIWVRKMRIGGNIEPVWQCEARGLRGKMSKIEEDFFGSI